MAGNLKALTVDELRYFENQFEITLIDNYIVVKSKKINRKVLHDIDKKFSLAVSFRKINITKQAIDIWINQYQGQYSLIEVQNAINTLIIQFQETNTFQIEEQLKQTRSKMNNNKEE